MGAHLLVWSRPIWLPGFFVLGVILGLNLYWVLDVILAVHWTQLQVEFQGTLRIYIGLSSAKVEGNM